MRLRACLVNRTAGGFGGRRVGDGRFGTAGYPCRWHTYTPTQAPPGHSILPWRAIRARAGGTQGRTRRATGDDPHGRRCGGRSRRPGRALPGTQRRAPRRRCHAPARLTTYGPVEYRSPAEPGPTHKSSGDSRRRRRCSIRLKCARMHGRGSSEVPRGEGRGSQVASSAGKRRPTAARLRLTALAVPWAGRGRDGVLLPTGRQTRHFGAEGK